MATVITVHGTFAHNESAVQSAGAAEIERQWWQQNSRLESDIRELVEGRDGRLDIARFEWSGDNSELGRREAGNKLLREFRELEAKKEPYCVVGHSHGGSVISTALLEAAARKNRLPGLERWITVGTPFVKLRKEIWLFARLNLIGKAILVASMMLLLMFLVYLAADLASGERMLFGRTFPGILVATGAMMSLPAVVVYFVLRYFERKSLFLYRRSVTGRAREAFGPRWLSLAHTDDEAIQGLAFLPGAKLYFFDKSFAVQSITLLSVFALPLLYLLVLASPASMVGIADWLNSEVYGQSSPETEAAVRDLRQRARQARQARRGAGGQDEAAGGKGAEERRAVWREYRAKREDLEARFPDLPSAERALRFRQRFFERDDRPCEGGRLCGGGHDLRINSALLLHVATDELSWAVGAEEPSGWRMRRIWSLALPAILAPIIAGLLALAILLAIRGVAILISGATSYLLNRLTNAEVKRAAFGNDTEGEIAIGAVDRPVWLDRSPPRLPAALADLVTAYSNGVASQSLAKFRRAIGQLASVEPKHTADSAISTYFTWKELVHSSYFDVPEFRKLIARAISQTGGFAPTARFEADPDFARTGQWLAAIDRAPGAARPPDADPPSPRDAEAVSAVVASTVRTEP